MRLGDLDALKDAVVNNFDNLQAYFPRQFIEEIDNAPTVPLPDFKDGYKQAIIDGKTNFAKLQSSEIKGGEKINCPKDLNQYLICEPIFENTFSPDECESRKFYGDCYHCFASAIAKRDRQIKQLEEVVRPKGEWKITGDVTCECQFCRYSHVYALSPKECGLNFCTRCGADMRGEEK